MTPTQVKHGPPAEETEALVLPPSTGDAYLKTTTPFNMESVVPSKKYVPRDFLSDTYGGGYIRHFQIIHADRNPSALAKRAAIFPIHIDNPAVPSNPGEHGLLLNGGGYFPRAVPQPWSLFGRNLDAKSSTWKYLGEYEFSHVGKMSGTAFRGQTESVRPAFLLAYVERETYFLPDRLNEALLETSLSRLGVTSGTSRLGRELG